MGIYQFIFNSGMLVVRVRPWSWREEEAIAWPTGLPHSDSMNWSTFRHFRVDGSAGLPCVPYCMILPHWTPIGETGAAYLFLPLWNIPVQQRQGERGKAYSGTNMFCMVTSSGRQQGFQKPTVFLSVRSRMYSSVFPLSSAEWVWGGGHMGACLNSACFCEGISVYGWTVFIFPHYSKKDLFPDDALTCFWPLCLGCVGVIHVSTLPP